MQSVYLENLEMTRSDIVESSNLVRINFFSKHFSLFISTVKIDLNARIAHFMLKCCNPPSEYATVFIPID